MIYNVICRPLFLCMLYTMCFFTSCRGEEVEKVIKFSFEDFDTIRISSVQVYNETYNVPLFTPLSIKVVSDSLIVILDSKLEEHFLTIVNTKNANVSYALGKGNGSEEALYIRNMYKKNDYVICYDKSGKVLSVKIDPKTLKSNIQRLTKLRTEAMFVCPTSDNGYLEESETCRYSRTDSQGNKLDEVGVFPVQKTPSGVAPVNAVFPVSMGLSPNLNYIVSANQFWNKIELYDGIGSYKKILSGPMEDDSDIQKRELPFGHIFVTNPSYLVFQDVCVQNEGFMVGYIGLDRRKVSKDKGALLKGFNRIMTFDVSGKPLKMAEFDHYIQCFDYNTKTKELFCVVEIDSEYKIIKYVINQAKDVFLE